MMIHKIDQIFTDYKVPHEFLSSTSFILPDHLTSSAQSGFKVYILPTSNYIDQGKKDKMLKRLESYQDHQILILTAVDGLELDFDDVPENVTCLHTGSDMMFQMDEYTKIQPQKEKNSDMKRFWISLNQTAKPHRILMASCLLGHDLGFDHQHEPETGQIKIDTGLIENFASWQDLYQAPSSLTDSQCDILQTGFNLLKSMKHGGFPGADQYRSIGFNNVVNFETYLRDAYFNSLVEFINETTFFNKAIFPTEKFLNSVYGYNLPIVVAAPGTVKYLRDCGFDMFDDIVDHSYDSIEDPLQRMFAVVECNKKLLTDRSHAWTMWNKARPRFDANLHYAKTHMYTHFLTMVENNLKKYIENSILKNITFGAPGRI